MEIKEFLEFGVLKEWIASFDESRNNLRNQASEIIAKIQQENRRTYNKRRKVARVYRDGELVAIKRTQQDPGFKFAQKYFRPYEIIKVLRNQRYIVRKVGEHEGPVQTTSAADFMKP